MQPHSAWRHLSKSKWTFGSSLFSVLRVLFFTQIQMQNSRGRESEEGLSFGLVCLVFLIKKFDWAARKPKLVGAKPMSVPRAWIPSWFRQELIWKNCRVQKIWFPQKNVTILLVAQSIFEPGTVVYSFRICSLDKQPQRDACICKLGFGEAMI